MAIEDSYLPSLRLGYRARCAHLSGRTGIEGVLIEYASCTNGLIVRLHQDPGTIRFQVLWRVSQVGAARPHTLSQEFDSASPDGNVLQDAPLPFSRKQENTRYP